jgi:2-polyprenyl-3-methyl-5-hydroxy-6-metoxy-1,4-benzoquinol methylase
MESRQSDLDHLAWLNKAGIKIFTGKRILDLGCGSGFLCHKAMAEGAKLAVGVDIIQPDSDQEAAKRNWSFLSLDLNDSALFKSIGDKFDLIFAFDIIEHLESPYNFLTACYELLSDTGVLVVTTPNLMSWEKLAKPTSWSGASDPQHKILFTKYSLAFLLDRSGFRKVTSQAPMRALSFLGRFQPQIGGQLLAVAEK